MSEWMNYFELHGLVHGFLFGMLGVLMAILSYFLFDLLDTRTHFAEEVKKGNMAAAVVLGAFVLGICIIVSSAIGS